MENKKTKKKKKRKKIKKEIKIKKGKKKGKKKSKKKSKNHAIERAAFNLINYPSPLNENRQGERRSGTKESGYVGAGGGVCVEGLWGNRVGMKGWMG